MQIRTGAKGALLDEYERALRELVGVIFELNSQELIYPVDPNTEDSNCISIQTILAHVVNSGFSYANYIREYKAAPVRTWTRKVRDSITEFEKDLWEMFNYTIETFEYFEQNEVGVPTDRKIMTRWGQDYDIEQLLEHAIVHILRHRRQIEGFKRKLKGEV